MKVIDRVTRFFTSLKLTVVCLAAALILVFAGTLAQKDIGLYRAQAEIFRSLVIYWSPLDSSSQLVSPESLEKSPFVIRHLFGAFQAGWNVVHAAGRGLQTMLQSVLGPNAEIPIFPGGYLIGTILLINLIAAHYKRFRFSSNKAGILLIHFGLIILLLGQFSTEMFQVESYMRLTEGETKNYSESHRKSELAVIDTTDPEVNHVVAVPGSQLARRHEIKNPELPFTIHVKEYYSNSDVENRKPDDPPIPVNRGIGQQLSLTPRPPTIQMDRRNLPSAILEIITPQGESLGIWLVSTWLQRPQSFEFDGRTYDLVMRFTRYYKPFSITLLDFRHDKYRGTDKPKNFSSEIRLRNVNTGEDQKHLIYMNHPLRYGGETYYQASFDPDDPRVTVLQVVRNPSWLIPYVSCTIIGIGLLLQFSIHLVKFIRKRKS